MGVRALQIIKIGLAPFGLTLAPEISLVVINRFSASYGGQQAIATYACISYVICIIYLLLQGVGDGSQPLMSQFYGAGQGKNLKETKKLAYKSSMAIAVIGGILMYLLRGQIGVLFGSSPAVNAEIIMVMPIFLLSLPADAVTRVTSAAFYATEKSVWSYLLILSEPVFTLVLVLILALVLPANARKKAEATATETEPSVSDVVESVETEPSTEEPVDPEAEALARLADSVGMGRSENVKTIIMWVAINRSEDRANGYGQSLLDEIARPSQWQNYDENIAYTAPTYELAKEVLNTVKTGGLRPLDSDMLWLVLNDDGSVTVRNQFNQKTGQKWREKTIK